MTTSSGITASDERDMADAGEAGIGGELEQAKVALPWAARELGRAA